MKRLITLLKDYKEILILLLAIGAVTQTPIAKKALAQGPPETSLSVRVDSIARNVDALIRLQCLRERDKWDDLNLAGIPCERLVNTNRR